MKHIIKYNGQKYRWNDQRPIDISIPIINQPDKQPNCFYAPFFEATPLKAGDFIGSTQLGGPVNFFNLKLNPHGNGTHTECVGHISENGETIHQTLDTFHTVCRLISVIPTLMPNGDKCITLDTLKQILPDDQPPALAIRCIPNDASKMSRQYSGTNPAYVTKEAMDFIVHKKIDHLLIDLPSVDREEDDGQLAAHKSFWQLNGQLRSKATITEMIFVGNNVKDDVYLLNMQILSLELDASPSKPILYALKKKN